MYPYISLRRVYEPHAPTPATPARKSHLSAGDDRCEEPEIVGRVGAHARRSPGSSRGIAPGAGFAIAGIVT